VGVALSEHSLAAMVFWTHFIYKYIITNIIDLGIWLCKSNFYVEE